MLNALFTTLNYLALILGSTRPIVRWLIHTECCRPMEYRMLETSKQLLSWNDHCFLDQSTVRCPKSHGKGRDFFNNGNT